MIENVAHTIALVIERKQAEAERERLFAGEQAATSSRPRPRTE